MYYPRFWPEAYAIRGITRNVSLLVLVLFRDLQRRQCRTFPAVAATFPWEPIDRCLAQALKRIAWIACKHHVVRITERKNSSRFPVTTRSRSRNSTGPTKSASCSLQRRHFGQIPFLVIGSSKLSSGNGTALTSGLKPSLQSVKQVKLKGGVMLRATIPYSRLTYWAPYLVPQLMQMTCLFD